MDSLSTRTEPVLIYNLNVTDVHTYSIGTASIWVHNASEGDACPPAPNGPGDKGPKSREVVNSGGKTVERNTVIDEDALLEEAEKAAGGSLDDYTEYKPGWWESPDGKRRIGVGKGDAAQFTEQ